MQLEKQQHLYKIIENKVHSSTGLEAECIEFTTTKELLKINFIKSHSRQEGFYRYSINRSSLPSRIPLLAEYNGGEKWLVIGFLDGDTGALNIPDWKSPDFSVGTFFK